MNIIETQNLSRRFRRIKAVQDVSFAVPEGAVCALLGPNGAGKSTTLHLLMNLLRPTSGTAMILGVDSTRLGERQLAHIGYVSEGQQQPLWMTVRQLLDYCRPFYPTWDDQLAKRLLKQFDLPEDRKLKHLSRGMLMKVALLSSLAYRPKLLLLDEPFSGLDPLVRDEFVSGILEASSVGDWTVLISSHDIEEVERLADRVVVLDRGRLQLSESAEALQSRFRRVEVTFGGSSAALMNLPPNWLLAEQSGCLVRFVDKQFDADVTERACRERFPEAIVIAHPMTLREIFVALAKSGRTQAKREAA